MGLRKQDYIRRSVQSRVGPPNYNIILGANEKCWNLPIILWTCQYCSFQGCCNTYLCSEGVPTSKRQKNTTEQGGTQLNFKVSLKWGHPSISLVHAGTQFCSWNDLSEEIRGGGWGRVVIFPPLHLLTSICMIISLEDTAAGLDGSPTVASARHHPHHYHPLGLPLTPWMLVRALIHRPLTTQKVNTLIQIQTYYTDWLRKLSDHHLLLRNILRARTYQKKVM